ncbi:MAG: serine/threonine-protein phosphatase [Myxococcales bacterium]|nr:serine/threonine-protein phosphatase [Myxococcales bacterium]
MNAAVVATPACPATPAQSPLCSFDHDPRIWPGAQGARGMRLRGAAASHIGYHRDNNEDRFLVRPDAGLFAVADGMGGHEAGEVASRLAVESLADAIGSRAELPARLAAVMARANKRIQEAAKVHARKNGMGTTLSALWLEGERAYVAHVGDTRIYRVRDGKMEQLTDDHTLLAEAIRSGFDKERAGFIFPSNVLTRAVGIRADVEPMLASFTVEPGDRFLICSDGLTDMVTEADIAARLALWPSPTQAAHALMNDALTAGGGDNVTVLVVDAG